MLLKSSSQILADLLSKCYKEQLVGLWLGEKDFLRVCGMCLSHVWYNLFGYVFFMAIGFLMGVMTISFALPIDLYKSLWISINS